jgi:hypothetical protein
MKEYERGPESSGRVRAPQEILEARLKLGFVSKTSDRLIASSPLRSPLRRTQPFNEWGKVLI